MLDVRRCLLGLLTLSILSSTALYAGSPQLSLPAIQDPGSISYQNLHMPNGVFHYIVIPKHSAYRVVPAASEELQDVEAFAKQYHSPFVINGGYFDPLNGKTTSFITLSGKLAGDPQKNPRLMDNPDLKPLMPQILNRTEFRVYACQEGVRYDIVPHNAAIPNKCQLQESLGAGPSLAAEVANTVKTEAFIGYQNGKLTRDPLGVNHVNARSAVGITANGGVILGMVAQTPDQPLKSGATLSQLQSLMRSVGVQKLMALDGGSSSSLVYEGKAVYGKLNAKGNPVRRKVKSVLLLQKL